MSNSLLNADNEIFVSLVVGNSGSVAGNFSINIECRGTLGLQSIQLSQSNFSLQNINPGASYAVSLTLTSSQSRDGDHFCDIGILALLQDTCLTVNQTTTAMDYWKFKVLDGNFVYVSSASSNSFSPSPSIYTTYQASPSPTIVSTPVTVTNSTDAASSSSGFIKLLRKVYGDDRSEAMVIFLFILTIIAPISVLLCICCSIVSTISALEICDILTCWPTKKVIFCYWRKKKIAKAKEASDSVNLEENPYTSFPNYKSKENK